MITRHDFRRSVEREQVHKALNETIGIVYPQAPGNYTVIEMTTCSGCGRCFSRVKGSRIIFCGPCIQRVRESGA